MSLDDLQRYLDADGLCPNPVFIIGSPRSGTTALAGALGRHPDLWVSKESYFLHQLYGQGRVGSVWAHNWNRATPSWLRAENVERAEFLGFLGIAVNALFTSRSGGRRWVDQTPLYTLMADDLAVMFPGASFVHIVRDGRRVVHSMSNFLDLFSKSKQRRLTDEVPEWAHDFQLACATWAEWVDTALTFSDAHPGRCLTIPNEELSTSPSEGFARMLAFLGLRPDDGPALAFQGPRVNSSFRRAPARARDVEFADWDPERRQTFAEIAGETLVRAGYATAAEVAEWSALEIRR